MFCLKAEDKITDAFVNGDFTRGFHPVHIRQEDHSRVVFVGDIHGDLMPVMKILLHEQLVKTDNQTTLTSCYIGGNTNVPFMKSEEDDKKMLEKVQWIGGNACVVCLGDILDNRRGARSDKYGVCGVPITQQFIMHLLYKLRQEARNSGGNIVWVLGNHCIANVSAYPHMNISDFAPHYFVNEHGNIDVVHDDDTDVVPNKSWRYEVGRYMVMMGATPMMLLSKNSTPYAIGIHGLISSDFARIAKMSSGCVTVELALANMEKGCSYIYEAVQSET